MLSHNHLHECVNLAHRFKVRDPNLKRMLDRVRLGLITVTQTTGTRQGKSGPKSQFMWALGTDAQLEADHGQMAEGVGFEPTVGYQPTTVFKTAALSRSAIPPNLRQRARAPASSQ